jgi:hypothetical protein
MSSRTNPTSHGSRGSSPRLAFDVRPCRRAQLVWTLFGLAVAAALCFSFTPHPAWRVIAPAAALALAWMPGLAVLRVKGPLAVRRCEWAAEGEWRLTCPNGRCETGRLAWATAALGPWILLAWTVRAGRSSLPSRRYALIGVSELGPAAFRVLRGRLSMLRQPHSARTQTVAP